MSEDQARDCDGWVDRHGDCLYRYALMRLRRPDLAADAVQETFLEALRARDSFAGRSTERTWLIGILRHKVVDHYRRSVREQASLNGGPHGEAGDTAFDRRGHWRVGPAPWRGDPARDMETRQFWEVVHGCLSGLPPDLADAFLLRELDGLGSDEVRELLRITPANLWARLYRARSLLRGCLEEHGFGRRPLPPRTKGTPRR